MNAQPKPQIAAGHALEGAARAIQLVAAVDMAADRKGDRKAAIKAAGLTAADVNAAARAAVTLAKIAAKLGGGSVATHEQIARQVTLTVDAIGEDAAKLTVATGATLTDTLQAAAAA